MCILANLMMENNDKMFISIVMFKCFITAVTSHAQSFSVLFYCNPTFRIIIVISEWPEWVYNRVLLLILCYLRK